MRIVIIDFGQLPPDDSGAQVLEARDHDNCYRRLVDVARKYLRARGMYVSMVWDRRGVDGRFWVASRQNFETKLQTPARTCRRSGP